jgi:hypothetical protein
MIAEYNKERDENHNCSGASYYVFYLKNDVSWKYYPKGLNDNPDIHWVKW